MHWYRFEIAPGDATRRRLDELIQALQDALRARQGRIPEEVCVLSAKNSAGGFDLLMSEAAYTLVMGLWPNGYGRRIDDVHRLLPWIVELGDERWLDVLDINSSSH